MLAKSGVFILLLLSSACTSSNFADNQKNQRRVNAADSADSADEKGVVPKKPYATGENPVATEPATETPLVEEMIPEIAVVPVPVGGAPLTCMRSIEVPNEVQCKLDLPNSTPSASNRPAVVFVISGAIPKQTRVSFKLLGSDSFSFELPASLQSLQAFGVGVGVSAGGIRRGPWNYGSEMFMTMVGYGKTDLTNVVKDPSFEEIAVASSGFSTLIQQGNFKYWMARNKADTGCLDLSPIIELQANHGKYKALDGKQWTELDSACAFDAGENAGNIGLFQDLTLVKDHVYAISFGVKRRAEAKTLQRMRMTWGENLLYEQDTSNEEWTVFSMIKTADQNTKRIDFEETGLSDGFGTLLDDIRIYDLGLPAL